MHSGDALGGSRSETDVVGRGLMALMPMPSTIW